MFDNAADFVYADASRIRLEGMKLLPERGKAGYRLPVGKDIAFIVEALTERHYLADRTASETGNRCSPYLYSAPITIVPRIHDDIGVTPGMDGVMEALDGLRATQHRWVDYSGIGPDAMKGIVYDHVVDETAIVAGGTLEEIRTQWGGGNKAPFQCSSQAPCDAFYVLKHATGLVTASTAMEYSGTTTYEGEFNGEAWSSEYTGLQDSIYYAMSGGFGRCTAAEGSAVIFADYCREKELVTGATGIFRTEGRTIADGYASNWFYEIDAVDLGIPTRESTMAGEDGDIHRLEFDMEAQKIAAMGADLERVEVTGLADSCVVHRPMPIAVILHYAPRTGLDGVDYDYTPDGHVFI